MNNETYEQMEVPAEKLKEQLKFLKEGMEVQIVTYEGEILGINLPDKVEYEVTETTEAVKGNTTNNAQKDATIETGYVVKVPLFIQQGEKILITTEDGKYAGRA
jgi:elongation factor P